MRAGRHHFQMFSTYEIAESIAVEAALARCIHVCTTELKNGHAGLASEASSSCMCRARTPSVLLCGSGQQAWALESADSPGLFVDVDGQV